MIYHKVIKNSKGQLKPVCDPRSPINWRQVPSGLINCKNCLQGKKSN